MAWLIEREPTGPTGKPPREFRDALNPLWADPERVAALCRREGIPHGREPRHRRTDDEGRAGKTFAALTRWRRTVTAWTAAAGMLDERGYPDWDALRRHGIAAPCARQRAQALGMIPAPSSSRIGHAPSSSRGAGARGEGTAGGDAGQAG